MSAVTPNKRLAAAEAQLDGLRATGQWDEAVKLAKTWSSFAGQVSQAHPTTALVEAYRLTALGEAAVQLKRLDDGRRYFIRALQQAPTYIDALVLLAQLNVDTGRWPGEASRQGRRGRGKHGRGRSGGRINIPGLHVPSLQLNLPSLQPSFFRRDAKHDTDGSVLGEGGDVTAGGGNGSGVNDTGATTTTATAADAGPASQLPFSDTDVIELLTRARNVSLEGLESVTLHRLQLRVSGLALLATLHERGFAPLVTPAPATQPPAQHTVNTVTDGAVAGVARAVHGVSLSRAAMCLLAAVAAADSLWQLLCLHVRTRFGVGAEPPSLAVTTVGLGPACFESGTVRAHVLAGQSAVSDASSWGPVTDSASGGSHSASASPSHGAPAPALPRLHVTTSFSTCEDVTEVALLPMVYARSDVPEAYATAFLAGSGGGAGAGAGAGSVAGSRVGRGSPSLPATGPGALQQPAVFTFSTGSSGVTSGSSSSGSGNQVQGQGQGQGQGQSARGYGPRHLLRLDPRCRDAAAACLSRMPLLLHRLGDLPTAVTAYVACLEWRGPLAQVLGPASRDGLIEGLSLALCENAAAARHGAASIPAWAWLFQSPQPVSLNPARMLHRTHSSAAAAAAAAPTAHQQHQHQHQQLQHSYTALQLASARRLGLVPALLQSLFVQGHEELRLRLGLASLHRSSASSGSDKDSHTGSGAPSAANTVNSTLRPLSAAFAPLHAPASLQHALSAGLVPGAALAAAWRIAECASAVVTARPRHRFGWAALALALGAQALLVGPGMVTSNSFLVSTDAEGADADEEGSVSGGVGAGAGGSGGGGADQGSASAAAAAAMAGSAAAQPAASRGRTGGAAVPVWYKHSWQVRASEPSALCSAAGVAVTASILSRQAMAVVTAFTAAVDEALSVGSEAARPPQLVMDLPVASTAAQLVAAEAEAGAAAAAAVEAGANATTAPTAAVQQPTTAADATGLVDADSGDESDSSVEGADGAPVAAAPPSPSNTASTQKPAVGLPTDGPGNGAAGPASPLMSPLSPSSPVTPPLPAATTSTGTGTGTSSGMHAGAATASPGALGMHIPDSVLLLLASAVSLLRACNPGAAASFASRAVAACGRDDPASMLATTAVHSHSHSHNHSSGSASGTRYQVAYAATSWSTAHVVACYEMLGVSLLACARAAGGAASVHPVSGPGPCLAALCPLSARDAATGADRLLVKASAALKYALQISTAGIVALRKTSNNSSSSSHDGGGGHSATGGATASPPRGSHARGASATVHMATIDETDDGYAAERAASSGSEAEGAADGSARSGGGAAAAAARTTPADADADADADLSHEPAPGDLALLLSDPGLQPSAWPALYHLGTSLLSLGAVTDAQAVATKALQLADAHARDAGSRALAAALTAAQPGSAAAAALTAALAAVPTTPSEAVTVAAALDPSLSLPWALAAVATSAHRGSSAAATVIAAGLQRHPNDVLLRLLEARCAEVLWQGEEEAAEEEDEEDDDEEEELAMQGQGVSEVNPLSPTEHGLVSPPATAPPVVAAAAPARHPLSPRAALSRLTPDLMLALYQDAATAAHAVAWTFIMQCVASGSVAASAATAGASHSNSSGAASSAASAAADPHASLSLLSQTTLDIGLRDALPVPAPPAPHAIRIAVAAHCHTARVAAAMGAYAVAHAAVAAADALVDALAAPMNAVEAHAARGVGGVAPTPAVLVGGFSLDNLAARSAIPVDPLLRADVIHAAGLLHQAAGALGAAEAQYAAALAIAPNHVPSLVQLAEVCVQTALVTAAGADSPAAVAALVSGPITTTIVDLVARRDGGVDVSHTAGTSSTSSSGLYQDARSTLDRGQALIQRALRISPSAAEAWNTKARLHAAAGQHEEAAVACVRSLQSRNAAALLPPSLLPLRVAVSV